jgi:hypothetical protein
MDRLEGSGILFQDCWVSQELVIIQGKRTVSFDGVRDETDVEGSNDVMLNNGTAREM